MNKRQVLVNVYSKSSLCPQTVIWLVKRSGEGAERKLEKGREGEKESQGRREAGREGKEERLEHPSITSLSWAHSSSPGYSNFI